MSDILSIVFSIFLQNQKFVVLLSEQRVVYFVMWRSLKTAPYAVKSELL